MIPLRLGTREQFLALKTLLMAADYTERAICERCELDGIHEFRGIRPGQEGAGGIPDALELLVRLFLSGEPVRPDMVRSLLPGSALDAFEALGLIRQAAAGLCSATAMLYPTESLYIVSDRIDELPEDGVFPAITPQTRRFLAILPEEPCDSLLDLCSGTGVAALLGASRYAMQAWACDISERCTVYAEFNRRLNGLTNVATLSGDLYEPVANLTFDRIVAHPPCIPSLRNTCTFRDGGEDGEQVTRAIITGLPRHLRSGGRFYASATGSDRRGARFELRVRRILGEAEREFDVLVVVRELLSPAEYCARMMRTGHATSAEIGQREAVTRRLEIENLVICAIVIQRRATQREVFTVRRQVNSPTTSAEVERLLRNAVPSA